MLSAHPHRRFHPRRFGAAAVVAALVAGLLGGFWQDGSAVAATTTYDAPTGPFTIGVGDTALLINGADITGDVLNDGTLEFGLTDNLTVLPMYSISGSGNVLLTASGTITFSGSNSYLAGTTISYGELVITAGGVVSHPAANMTVGDVLGESGTLRLTGGSLANYDGDLGNVAGSAGAAFVTSGTWTNTNDLNIGYSGTGAVTISGGSVTVAGSTILGRDDTAFGELIVSGGSLSVGSVLNVGQGGVGQMTINGGYVSDVDAYIGANSLSSGTATITSGTWFNGGNLIVGFGGGVGELNISGAGVVVVGDTLSRDSLLGAINLNTGGTLIIGTGTDTGTLDTDLTNNGTLIFDRSDPSQYVNVVSGTGHVIKRGAGTLQFTGSNTYSGGTEILDGRIDVAFGGAIVHPSATLSIGNSTGASGGLDVSVGTVNTALLDITNGDLYLTSGLVESGTARIGVFGTGTATIAGGVFGTVDSLFVGYSGTGTMDVNGGNVVATETMLGALAGDRGEVSVTNGSAWGNFGNFTVGGAGTGMLTISNGGSVLVTGTLSKGAGSTINLNLDGTLRIGDGGTTGALATNLTNNGLLVFNRSNAYTYGGQIDGAGAVTKLGGGALTFSGSSSYAGQTKIEAGSFYVDGQLGNTSVVVNGGALLGGGGTVLGSVTVGDVSGTTAIISPGSVSDAIAILTVGSLELTAGSLTQMTVGGTVAGDGYDQIAGVVAGSELVYGGQMEITLSGSYADYTTFHLFTNFTAREGTNFDSIVLNATGPAYAMLSGTFSYDGATGLWATEWTKPTPGGQRLLFSTVTGDLIVVPEPSTLVMGAAGVGFFGLLRWRRRRQRAARLVADQVPDQLSDQVTDQA